MSPRLEINSDVSQHFESLLFFAYNENLEPNDLY